MKRPRLNPRKLLIASAGVATVNYALAAGCGGNAGPGPVANLMAPVAGGTLGGSGGTGAGSVANLVAPPPTVSGTGGGSVPGPVANLVAPPPPVGPPPVGLPSPVPPDASVPDAATDAADAAVDAG